jgi:hypothetical protein
LPELTQTLERLVVGVLEGEAIPFHLVYARSHPFTWFLSAYSFSLAFVIIFRQSDNAHHQSLQGSGKIWLYFVWREVRRGKFYYGEMFFDFNVPLTFLICLKNNTIR